ncbi:MAG TPA: T9SS type A sorting domain-containing protein, partial [Candidatus Kapabacteria bacterium]|nr:T9SS type A sorting domain-containing protein [Candidatus Kapabacteria bacterium]
NPAHDEMLVRYNAGANAEIGLYNVLGARMMSVPANGMGDASLNVGTLPAGMYMLSLRSGTAIKTEPVMVVR